MHVCVLFVSKECTVMPLMVSFSQYCVNSASHVHVVYALYAILPLRNYSLTHPPIAVWRLQ